MVCGGRVGIFSLSRRRSCGDLRIVGAPVLPVTLGLRLCGVEESYIRSMCQMVPKLETGLTLIPGKDCSRDPDRYLEVRRFPSRADPDDKIHKAAITQSIGASKEQDSDLSDLRRRGEEQIGGRRRPLKDGMVVPQRQ